MNLTLIRADRETGKEYFNILETDALIEKIKKEKDKKRKEKRGGERRKKKKKKRRKKKKKKV